MVTRRYFATLLDASHFVVKCDMSGLRHRGEGRLFGQLLDMFYAQFEVNDFTGDALTDKQMVDLHYSFVNQMQRVAFTSHTKLRDFALSNVGAVDTRESLTQHFSKLTPTELHEFCAKLCIMDPLEEGIETPYTSAFLTEVLVAHAERRLSQIDAINDMPLYPTDQILWDENIVPSELYNDGCLALPKLNLQFLTLHDYLLRNLNLFRLESTYEIRLVSVTIWHCNIPMIFIFFPT